MKRIFFMMIMVIVISCKSSDPGQTPEEMLTSAINGWVYTSVIITTDLQTLSTVEAVGNPAFDEYYSACRLDDAIVFTSDGKYHVDNNTKCDDTEAATLDTGTWAFSSNHKDLSIAPLGGSPYSYTVSSITASTIKIAGEVYSEPAVFTLKPKQ